MATNPPAGGEQEPRGRLPASAGQDLGAASQTAGQPAGTVAQFEVWQSRSGPLPSPQEFREYESVIPGLPGRIIEQWESETEHRREMERAVVTAGVALQRNGQRIAAGIALIAVVGGIVLASLGKNVAGLASILTPLALIAGAFIWGRMRSG